MNAIYLLIPISLLFLLLAIVAFLWASKRRQFDDMDTPALQVLMDDVLEAGPQSKAPTSGDAKSSRTDATSATDVPR